MNKTKISSITGGIVAAAVIAIIVFQITTNENNEPEIKFVPPQTNQTEKEPQTFDAGEPEIFGPQPNPDSLIEEKYEEIENKTETYEYQLSPRDWPTSGPFQIDRSKYVLGENIFVSIGHLNPNEKGQIAFLRPLNETYYEVYKTIPFDGSTKETFNQYFKPSLSSMLGICGKDDLIGRWAVVFQGTNYENLYFEVVDQIIPGDEENYKPVC